MKFLTRQEEMVLLSVFQLKGNSYLVKIREHLIKITGKEWSISSVYVPLEKLRKEGYLDMYGCELTIIVEETWPRTEAFAVCAGMTGSGSGPEYKLNFPNLKFTEDTARVDTELTQDMLTWINTFQIYPKDALEYIGCTFGEGSP